MKSWDKLLISAVRRSFLIESFFKSMPKKPVFPGVWIIPVPFFSPRFSSYWIHLITPIPSSIARPLAEGLRNPVICHDNRIRDIIPQELLDCRQTIRLALEKIEQQRVDTCWMDASAATIPQEWIYCGDTHYAGGTILELGYRIQMQATPEEIWKPIVKMGGKTGWYFGKASGKYKGWFDRLIGGIGFRGGRRHPTELRPGDPLDFWRVLEITPPTHLLLLAEMKLPGEALLEFKIKPLPEGPANLSNFPVFSPGDWSASYTGMFWNLSIVCSIPIC